MWHVAEQHQGTKPPKLNGTKASDTLETADTKHDPPVDRGKCAFQYLIAMLTIETTVWGFATSFGVLFDFYQHDPRSPIKPDPHANLILTLVGTINTGIIAATAPLISFCIAKNPGIRRTLMFSGLLVCTLSLFLSAYSTSAFHILLSQGIGYGIGGCALYFSALSHLPEWFDLRRGFANGLVFTGTGLGGLVFPLILNSLLSKFGSKFAMKVISALFAIPILLAVFFIRPRIANGHQRHDSSARSASSSYEKPATPSSENLFRNFRRCLTGIFWTYIFLNTVQSTAYYLPGLYLPTYSHCLGHGSVTGSALLSILNAGTILAQLVAGVLSDHYSPFLIGVTANILGGASVLVLWGALSQHGIVWLFVFAAFYGSTAGAWTSLYFRVLKHFISDPELLFCGYGILSMTRGIGNIVGGAISSALVSSTPTDPDQCSSFPKVDIIFVFLTSPKTNPQAKQKMAYLSFPTIIRFVFLSVSLVMGAPSKFRSVGNHAQGVSYTSAPVNYVPESNPVMNKKVYRLSRRSPSNPRIILSPGKSANSDLAEALLNAASVLRSDTAAVYSSISMLKKSGQLGRPEDFGDDVVFQLTEWQKHADMLRFLGDVKERTDFVDQMDEFSDDIALTLKSAAQALKQTLLGVNTIITEMPSIQYLLGPMVYNIRAIIADVHHRSEALANHNFSLQSNFDEDFSLCSTLESIKQFC
ncbi:hypothetical protein PtA15_6A195 [Puccinia triticina]|nr:uncharacterized protein PtA15_6A195 [Puccinia triticina]WAQ85567.1 hypothetical protein PtA15_6A195 [Puccinia triticina]